MPGNWSQRLLTLLQLTRMALVFTAIADALCGFLLWETARQPHASLLSRIDLWNMLLLAAISVGLYGFGMSLNDIIDRRRDRQISPNRPIPSGRVSTATAHFICFGLLAMALVAGFFFRAGVTGAELSLPLVGVTLVLIWFYDSAGKYLVAAGLLTLGLIRFAHAMIPALQADAPYHPLIWHPLWLLNHVAILSAVCYQWEEKRPPLNRKHWSVLVITLLALDGGAIWMVGNDGPGSFFENLKIDLRLIGPAVATLLFVAVAMRVRKRSPSSREAGQATMLYGLLWLIAYDACFAGLYVHWAAGVALLALLPVAYLSVQMMRWWSKIIAASKRPDFRRAE